MGSGPEDLTALHRSYRVRPSWLIDLVQPAIGGGSLDAGHLAKIEGRPRAVALRVSGLDQTAFERFVSDYGSQFTAIQFWKCPRIADLTPLEDLPGLQMLSFYWNQRSPRLWNFARTPALRALRFQDFTRLHRLDDLCDGHALEELSFGDAVWSKSTFETLEPLAGLRQLRTLHVDAKRIDDGRIQPLATLTSLRKLGIPANLFTTEQIAWLTARLPASVESASLAPLMRIRKPLELNGKTRDVLLIGKRKPFLNSKLDATRIDKHVRVFNEMLANFQADPGLEPSPSPTP